MGNQKSLTKDISYKEILEIGRGGFGTVTLCQRRQGGSIALVAKKRIAYGAFTQSDRDMVFAEIQLLRDLSHPNIAEMIEFWDEKGLVFGGAGIIIMKYYANGSARSLLGKGYTGSVTSIIQNDQRMQMFLRFTKQMFSALEYIHARKIIHRDIKLDNILVEQLNNSHLYDFYLSDFGISHVGSSSNKVKLADIKNLQLTSLNSSTIKIKNVCGTFIYMAPEMLAGKGYGRSVDVYALGLALLELRSGTAITNLSDFSIQSLQAGNGALLRSRGQRQWLGTMIIVIIIIMTIISVFGSSNLFYRLLTAIILFAAWLFSFHLTLHWINSKMIDAISSRRTSVNQCLDILSRFQDNTFQRYSLYFYSALIGYLLFGGNAIGCILSVSLLGYISVPFLQIIYPT